MPLGSPAHLLRKAAPPSPRSSSSGYSRELARDPVVDQPTTFPDNRKRQLSPPLHQLLHHPRIRQRRRIPQRAHIPLRNLPQDPPHDLA